MKPETGPVTSTGWRPAEAHTSGDCRGVRYHGDARPIGFRVEAKAAPPESLLLEVEMAIENGAYYLRAIQADVAVEADNLREALLGLAEAVRGWLEYLREEEPDLAPDQEPQRRYTRLLDFDSGTWFGRLKAARKGV